jgi:hypothetical protein
MPPILDPEKLLRPWTIENALTASGVIAGVCARLISIARIEPFLKRFSTFRDVLAFQSWIGEGIELLSVLTIRDGKLHSPSSHSPVLRRGILNGI